MLRFGPLFADHRHRMKEMAVWNIEKGLSVTIGDKADTFRPHTPLFGRVGDFRSADQNGSGFPVCSVTQLSLFPVEVEHRPKRWSSLLGIETASSNPPLSR